MKLTNSTKRFWVGVLLPLMFMPSARANSNSGPVSASDQQVQAIDLVGKQEQKKVDLFTGSFGYSIPIACAPARNGSEPNLALAYSSSGDNGWCGMGWDLNIGYIERNVRDGFPILYSSATPAAPLTQYDDSEGFMLNLFGKAYKLFSVATNATIVEYQAEVDTEFLRCFLDTVNNDWTVYDKSGNAYYFGESAASRVANPKTGWSGYSGTFHWALDQIVTATGDLTTIAYTTYTSPNTSQPEGVVYPTQITYNGHTSANGYSANFQGPNTISFQTALRTNDWRFSYRWGFRTEQCRRLTNIVCQAGGTNVWRYSLNYGISAATSRSLLTNMVVCGYNASGTVIPFLTNTFAYQGNPNGVSFGPTIMWTNLNISDPGSSTVYYPEVAQVYLDDNGDNYTVADLVDIDGDGLPDRVVYDSTTSPNQFDVQKNLGMQGNSFGQFSTNSYSFSPTSTGSGTASARDPLPDDTGYAELNSAYGRFRDLDGDGLPDRVMDYWAPFVTSGTPYTNFTVMLNNGTGFSGVSYWAMTNAIGPTDPDYAYLSYECVEGGGTVTADGGSVLVGVGLFDLNGDGRPDRIMTGFAAYTTPMNMMTNLYVQSNTGTNFTKIHYFPYKSQNWNGTVSGQDAASVSLLAGIETTESHFMDLNGDGLPDHIMWPINSSGQPLLHSISSFAVEYNDGYSFESTNISTSVSGAADQWPGVVAQANNGQVHYNSTTFWSDAMWDLPFAGLWDVNGDGLPDRVVLDQTTLNTNVSPAWLVYLNNGHGFNTTPIRLTNIESQGHYSLFTDVPWWSPQGYNSGANGDVSEITTLMDINGDGLLDRVMAVYYNPTFNPTSNYFLVQLNQGPFPDLLISVNNGIGGTIGVTYNPSTDYDNRVDTTNPNSVSHMPFPRYVTATVTASDGINQPQTTTYGYGGGFFDGVRREFHGFAVVTNTDPTLRSTVTYFHTGGGRNYSALGEYQDTGNFAKSGMAYRVETYGNDNELYHVQVNQVNQVSLGNARYFPFMALTFDCDYPGNGTPYVTATQFSYDASGNVTNKIEYGQVNYFNLSTFGYTDATSSDNRYFGTTYATITSNSNIVDHPAKALLSDANNNTVKETDYSYNSSSGTIAQKLTRISAGYYETNGYGGYNSYGVATLRTNPVGVVTIMSYDSTYTYPETTRLEAIPGTTSSGDFITTTIYDVRSGELAISTDPSGLTISNSFDVFLRLTETDKIPIGGGSAVWMKKISYPAVFQPIVSGQAVNYLDVVANDGVGGMESRTYIDGFWRPIQTVTQGENGNYRVLSTAYDPRGNAFLTTWPVFGTSIAYTQPVSGQSASWIGYDAAGRVAISRPVNATFSSGAFSSETALTGDTGSPLAAKTWSYVYNSSPWWIICTDEDGQTRRYGLDAFGHTNQIQEVDGSSTYTNTLKYDLADNLTNIVNANAENIYWAYNNAGGVVAMADPYLGQWTYQRDYAGRLRVQTDARGDVISNSYINPSTGYQDALGRLQVQTAYSTNYLNHTLFPAFTNTYIYDSSGGDSAFTVYLGLLYKVLDGQGWEKSGYDTRARTVTTSRYLNINSNTYTTAYSFDDGDNITSLAYPNSGPTITNVYFHGGSLNQVSRSGGSGYYYNVSAAGYDQFEHVTNFTYGSGLTTTRTYYPVSKRLENIAAGSVFSRTYKYTAGDDVTNISGTGLSNAVSVVYYNLHRIKAYSGLSNSYAYDPTGNITNNIEGGGSKYTYASPRIQAVRTAFGYTNLYDLCGNMLVRHGGLTNSQAMVYDPDNRLSAIAQAGVMSDQFGYAYDGARLWKRINQNPTNIQVWLGKIYEQKGGKTLYHVFAGGAQVCTFETNSALYGGSDTNRVSDYYHEDSLNTSSALSSSTGAQLEINVYYPFGRTQTASPQSSFQVSRRFTGQVFDVESGLYYYNARYYDPELGRFIQPDDRIPDLTDPQSYNRYSYCLNDPLRYTDPSGHDTKTTWYEDLGTIVGSLFATPPQPSQKNNYTQISLQTRALGPTENIMPAMVSKGVEMAGQAAQTVAEQYVGGKVFQVGGAVIGEAGGAMLSKVTGVAGDVGGSEARIVQQVVQQAQGKPIMTQWGWQNSPAWREAANEVGNAAHKATIMNLGQKVPTLAEAKAMIDATGGRVLRIEEHEPGGVSTHTFPHINYETKSGKSASLRIQALEHGN